MRLLGIMENKFERLYNCLLNLRKIKYENSKFFEIVKKRDLNQLVRRRGRVYIINKKIQNLKKTKVTMDNESHKKTWNNFTKFVL